MLTRVLQCPALARSSQHAGAAHVTSALQRRAAELRHAYATHMEVERMAALAVATPRSPLLDTLFSRADSIVQDRNPALTGTPGGRPSAPQSLGEPPSAVSPQPLWSPLSAGTPAYLKNPFAHAETTLQLLGCPGARAGAPGHIGAAAATPREAPTLLALLSQEQAVESLGTLGRCGCCNSC